jgi:hypothetical protein
VGQNTKGKDPEFANEELFFEILLKNRSLAQVPVDQSRRPAIVANKHAIIA